MAIKIRKQFQVIDQTIEPKQYDEQTGVMKYPAFRDFSELYVNITNLLYIVFLVIKLPFQVPSLKWISFDFNCYLK